MSSAAVSASNPFASQISQLEQAAGNNPGYKQALEEWEKQIQTVLSADAGGSGAASAPASITTPAHTAAPVPHDTTPPAAQAPAQSAQNYPASVQPGGNAPSSGTPSGSSSGSTSTSTAQPDAGESKIPTELSKYAADIQAASKASGVPEDRIAAVIWDESRGQAGAATTNGGNGLTDGGLMQLNPATFQQLQHEHPDLQGKSLSDPATNIEAGADLLADEHAKYGSWDLAERAYNSGEGSVDTANANITTTGLGDPDYIKKVDTNLQAIDNGTALPA
ncbi:lytic transglycosylase domain-containing protein [Acetobacter farinalis]|uniref:Lytic transglycosylase domain-containing protein n=1 Tax=Acetobacter farinalis TaxID=1260984 RepID=A0ABT3Q9M1_9PROT|nr:lytic transglycosylase domain-containing protein [Acetobacter farinalis]MCX2561993.1 lytic transglycosylase domain-containing protein [Acetobacter farinalis]NHO30621.1 transglycosylase SLT domain-containing protein [Acetobacter farinalis]